MMYGTQLLHLTCSQFYEHLASMFCVLLQSDHAEAAEARLAFSCELPEFYFAWSGFHMKTGNSH